MSFSRLPTVDTRAMARSTVSLASKPPGSNLCSVVDMCVRDTHESIGKKPKKSVESRDVGKSEKSVNQNKVSIQGKSIAEQMTGRTCIQFVAF
jgi:hypothetical protein